VRFSHATSSSVTSQMRGRVAGLAVAFALALAGCATTPRAPPSRTPEQTRAQLIKLLPASVRDRGGWAGDITAAFAALRLDPTDSHLCAALAVTEQESNFAADPAVPNLGATARAEIDRRAKAHHIPGFVVSAALALKSRDGRSYNDRIAAARTERELSLVFEDLIGRVPLGRQLFADDNPIRTGGPMQVSVSFAERYVRGHEYPYSIDGSIRHEVFTRRGGVYFGIAHLLGYPVSYDRMLYRFADYNAGFYASRNAAFQNAVAIASGIPLALDGDLVDYSGKNTGKTALAARTLAPRLQMSEREIDKALAQGESFDFEKSPLYARVHALAEGAAHKPLPRAMLPRIALESPKITRKLTTQWFAERVQQRYQSCLGRARR